MVTNYVYTIETPVSVSSFYTDITDRTNLDPEITASVSNVVFDPANNKCTITMNSSLINEEYRILRTIIMKTSSTLRTLTHKTPRIISLTSTDAPQAIHDVNSGFCVGDTWRNSQTIYDCTDTSVNVAVWVDRADIEGITKGDVIIRGETISERLHINGDNKIIVSQSTKALGLDWEPISTIEPLIDHTKIASIGTNTHMEIDTHINNISNPHNVTKTQIGLSNIPNTKVNFSATSDPISANDSSSGYSIGSRWINISTSKEYVCTDDTINLAIWEHTTVTGNSTNANTATTYVAPLSLSTTSSTFVDIPGFSITITTGTLVHIALNIPITISSKDRDAFISITNSAGTVIYLTKVVTCGGSNIVDNIDISFVVNGLVAGSNTFKVRWKRESGTLTMLVNKDGTDVSNTFSVMTIN